MARERIDDFHDLAKVFEIEHYSNRIMQKIDALLGSLYTRGVEDLRASAASLCWEQVEIQGPIEQAIDKFTESLSEEMQLQFAVALNRRDYDELIRAVPEDSPMHAICRLQILARRLQELREDLADRIQYRFEIEDGFKLDELDLAAQDGGLQEVGGSSDMELE